jgi:hypothetical protein
MTPVSHISTFVLPARRVGLACFVRVPVASECEAAMIIDQETNKEIDAQKRRGSVISTLHRGVISILLVHTLHDLRRTYATNLRRLSVKLEVIEALINHVSGTRSGFVGVYQRHHYEEKCAKR